MRSPNKSAVDDEDLDLSYSDEERSFIEKDPIRITLSGHTCSGKTEWLNSLLGMKVGESSPEPDTTKQIKWETLSLPGSPEDSPFIMISDVPGQQFSSQILGLAKRELGPRPRPGQMEVFITQYEKADGDHQSDVRLLKHFRSCDVILYVVDCKDEPMIAVEDEFELVRRLGRPVIAVLNFSGAHAQRDHSILNRWREAFEFEGASAVIELDAFDKDPVALRELGNELSSAFDDNPLKLKFMQKYWSEAVMAKEEQRLDAALNVLAEFLLNAATYRVKESVRKGKEQSQTEKRLKTDFRRITYEKIAALPSSLIEIYPEFFALECDKTDAGQHISDNDVRHRPGYFNDSTAKQVSKSMGRGAAIGGLIGVSIDIVLGGLSGGGGMALGAFLGAAADVGLSLRVSKTPLGVMGSSIEISLSDRTLKTCCVEGLALIDALRRRGFGSTEPLDVKARKKRLPPPGKVMELLAGKRSKHSWSQWSNDRSRSERRRQFIDELKFCLQEVLDESAATPQPEQGLVARATDQLLVNIESNYTRLKSKFWKR